MKTAASRTTLLADHFYASLDARLQAMKDGPPVIRLDVGSPDLPPPAPILQALNDSAAKPGNHGYQPIKGELALRQAWAGLYQRYHGVMLDPDSEIVTLLGSKEGIFHLSLAVLEAGDAALVPDPGYMTYARGALFAGAEPVALPLRRENGYLPDFAEIPAAVLSKARILWLNYPNNPTSAVASLAFYQQAVDFARKNNLLVVADSAYTQITFDGFRAPSILEIPGASQVAIEFNTLSKSHNMAGWRMAVAVGNQQVIKSLGAVQANASSGAFKPVVDAAIAALNGDQGWLAERNAIYAARRDLLVKRFRALGWEFDLPRGALYLWLKLPFDGISSAAFTSRLLESARVSLTPGTVFGASGEGYVRLAFTSPEKLLLEAIDRIEAAWPILQKEITA